ncbi:right-handed parallel beta-helix repeat-containing protein [Marinococcus halophilus]|uniref:right-handed parallel beta-helix repeat-containing protein n=1 Tax=Marinococcus halophilus TaxID=1371 RepID=UPI0009A8907A|nr:right-handed parallel beta-helix repeat-containing protein [Marinococcus halophilus]
MKKLWIALTLLLVGGLTAGLLLFSECTQATGNACLYVSTDGNDSNDGSRSDPLRTLDAASEQTEPGMTVYVRGGTYEEPLEVAESGSSSKPITFEAYEDEEVILSGSSLEESAGITAMIKVENQDFITIRGFTIQDLSTELNNETPVGIFVHDSAEGITVDNNHVRGIETNADSGNAHGIAVYGREAVTDIEISNNTVEDLVLGSSEAVVLNGNVEDFTIASNTVRHNDNIGIDMIGYEDVGDDPALDYTRNGTVENNTVYDNSSYGNPAYGEGEVYGAGGIYVDGGSDIDIKNNTVYRNDLGIEATSEQDGEHADDIRITGNTVYENNFTGISIGGYDEKRGGTKDSTIAENIMYRNDTKDLDGGQLLLQNDTENNRIENNILTASSSRVFIANYFENNTGNEFRQNVYHREKGKESIWVWENEQVSTLNEFQSLVDSGTNSRYVNPEYKNASNYNFELSQDSPAREVIE